MADSLDPNQSGQVCNYFKKPSKKPNIRKRALDDEDEDAKEDGGQSSGSSAVRIEKAARKADNKLYFSTATARTSKSSAQFDGDSEEPVFQFESSKVIQVQHDSKATATLETETEFTRDARAIRERVLKQADESLKGKAPAGDAKIYKGMHGYTDYTAGFRREQTVSSEKAGGAHGPLRASAHIRVSARFDYQPDICKDYKETGYCGYGDSCKFMHDRGDYKSGWQMEREWEEAEKERKRKLAAGIDVNGGEGEGDDDDDEDDLPFACFICRQPFVDPVVTKCKHYFCEHCALKHHSKNKKCYVCNKPTLGIFNTAHEIRRKMAEEK
ncbi:zinc finger CCCH domain-containing protein 1-like [Nymphaea colorata]|nr:zinc finger CCCH domain-containing protein 1-like [Nymphaea colorata]XP_031476899.1 zinc finger CCCH domain-containing protein 1-like [Nymphaea colorata]